MEALDLITQSIITGCGGTAIWLINSRSERARAWGVIFGLCGQPAWYVQLVLHDQWLMLPVYAFYTAAWLKGLRVNWLERRSST